MQSTRRRRRSFILTNRAFQKQLQPRPEAIRGVSFLDAKSVNLRYFEEARGPIIPGEMMTGEKKMLASVSAIKTWKPPFDREAMEEPKKEQVVANVAAALDFLGIKLEFD